MYRLTIGLVLALIVIGLVVLSSAGIVDGQKKFNSPYYYVTHQLLYGVLPGLAAMIFLSWIDYRRFKPLALPILFIALVLMILVFMPNFGFGLKGATRWLSIAGISFQPSEFLKLALVIYLAAWFGNRDSRIRNWTYGTAPFFVVLSFIALLLYLQPDIGTLIIVGAIAMGLYFFAGARFKHLAMIAGIGLAFVTVAVVIAPYRLNRIKAFLNPEVDPRGISYQLNQSQIAIGSGGLFGLGFGRSSQKFGFLPEPVNDSIFAIVGEELGFAGSVVIVGFFVMLGLAMTQIARSARDQFGRLLVLGVCVWVVGQAFINIGAITGVMPLTGVPLPFISYGGTAMISLLAAMGLVLSVAKNSG